MSPFNGATSRATQDGVRWDGHVGLIEVCIDSLSGHRTPEDSADAVWSVAIRHLAILPKDLQALIESVRVYERSRDIREPSAHWTRVEMRRAAARVVVQRVLAIDEGMERTGRTYRELVARGQL